MNNKVRLVSILIFLWASVCFAWAQDAPKATIAESTFKFGKAVRGTVVEHEYVVRNEGSKALSIKNVVMSIPLKVLKMPASVPAGGEGLLKFSLDTAQVGNFYEGVIVVTTDDPAQPEIQLQFDGNIISTVEVSPMPAFYISSQRGEAKEATVEIISHEQDPLRIEKIESPSKLFTVDVQTVEEGKRYSVVLRMSPTAPLGKNNEVIKVHTSSVRSPVIQIGAHTFVRDRVYTFPQTVDFGQIRLNELRTAKETPDWAVQRLMVYESDRTGDFEVQLSSDLGFVKTMTQRAPTGDRYQVFISLDADKLKAGTFKGTLQISTNDSLVKKLAVPISGTVVE